MSEAQHKIAERLIILNDRCVGLLTRLYNIKKSCGNINSRPKALTEKDFEQAISIVVKKFPVNDLRKHSVIYTAYCFYQYQKYFRVLFPMLIKVKLMF